MALLLFCLRCMGNPLRDVRVFCRDFPDISFRIIMGYLQYLYFCNWDLFSSILKGTIPLFCVEFRPVELHVQCSLLCLHFRSKATHCETEIVSLHLVKLKNTNFASFLVNIASFGFTSYFLLRFVLIEKHIFIHLILLRFAPKQKADVNRSFDNNSSNGR